MAFRVESALNRRTVIRLGVSFGIGLVGGWALNHFGDLSREGSILGGLLLTVLCELTILISEQAESEKANEVILALSSSLAKGGGFSSFISQQIISGVRGAAVDTYRDGLRIRDPERVPLFWTSCMMHLDSSLQVVAHIHPKHWWTTGYSESNVAMQYQKVAEGKRIERVFIWDDSEEGEFDEIRKAALEQREHGIIVKHLSLQTLENDRVLRRWAEKLGTPDVAVIDGQWGVLHFLDRDRDTRELRITGKDARVQEIDQYWRNLLAIASSEFDEP